MSYIRLKDKYRIREEINDSIIFENNVEQIVKRIVRLPKPYYGLLRLSTGEFTVSDLIKMYSEVTSISCIESKKIIDKFINDCKEYLEFTSVQNIRNNVNVDRDITKLVTNRKFIPYHRLTSPLLISLVLTYKCNCFCKYCFVNASKENAMEMISTEKILDLIKEANTIGVAALNITGGEPFIRNDIYRILSSCFHNKMVVNIATKKRFTYEEVLKLKQTGITDIQVSLDTIDNDISEYLTGIKNFAYDMLTSIKILIDNGINVTVNSVITRYNIDSIPNLIKYLNSIGVYRQFLTPYLRTLGRHSDNLFPKLTQYKSLDKFMNNYNGKTKVEYARPDYEQMKIKNLENIQRCSGGRMSLVILPNGKVTICERLIDEPFCIVGDINTQTLEEVWNSVKMANVIEPDREKFYGTDCYNCNSFKKCILDKGLCYARTKIAYGTIFNKDPLCPHKTQYIKFV